MAPARSCWPTTGCGRPTWARKSRRPDVIRLTTHFDLYGTSLFGCSAGYPLGFSCTSTTSHESVAYTAVCSTATSCEHAFGSMYFYAGSGGNYNEIEMSVTVSLVRSDGNTFTFQVAREGVDGF